MISMCECRLKDIMYYYFFRPGVLDIIRKPRCPDALGTIALTSVNYAAFFALQHTTRSFLSLSQSMHAAN